METSFQEYDWDSDSRWISGASEIMPEQMDRAKMYYYKRFIDPDFDLGTRAVARSEGNETVSNDTGVTLSPPEKPQDKGDDSDPPKLTFAEIADMVSRGVPIPGVKNIPETTLPLPSGASFNGSQPSPKKPWEQT